MFKSDPRTSYVNIIDRLMCRLSRVYSMARYRYLTWRLGAGREGVINLAGSRSDDVPEYGLARFRLHLASFVDIARNAGASPLLMIQPRLPHADLDEAGWKLINLDFVGFSRKGLVAAYAAADAAIRTVGLAKAVTVVEANAAIPSDAAHFGDAVHVTPKGSQAFAKVLADALEPVIRAIGSPSSR